MEILFKDDKWLYSIRDGDIQIGYIEFNLDIDLSTIKHLDDAEVLYHYKDITNNRIFPVYYEHNGRIITENSIQIYYATNIDENFIKDYTLVNLKLLEDGNII